MGDCLNLKSNEIKARNLTPTISKIKLTTQVKFSKKCSEWPKQSGMEKFKEFNKFFIIT